MERTRKLKFFGMRALEKPRRRWEDSIKMDFKETNIELEPNIVRAIKSRKLRWAGHIARMEEDRSVPKF